MQRPLVYHNNLDDKKFNELFGVSITEFNQSPPLLLKKKMPKATSLEILLFIDNTEVSKQCISTQENMPKATGLSH